MSTSSNSTSTPTRKISFPLEALFQSAVQDSDNEELWRLLKEFANDLDVNETNHAGLTPLHYSVLSNNLDGVKMLIGHGADVDIADCHGFTPLHTAAACGYLQLVTFLVMFGANVFAVTEDGDLPVDIAKDTATASILTEQMVLRIHSKEYVNSWLLYHSKEMLRSILHLVLFLISSVIAFISDILFSSSRGHQLDPGSPTPPNCEKQHHNSKTD